MTERHVTDLVASVRSRLFDVAKRRGEDFQRVLTQYALERLLYRLSLSESADAFVLKGALLFSIWMEDPHRSTKDLDLLGTGEPSPSRLAAVFRGLCELDVTPDGLDFDASSVSARPMRESDIYGGIRVTLVALLGKARIPLQVDVGFGDVVTPPPVRTKFPTILDFPAPELRAYPRETVIAEKLSAMVALDLDNSRMKDFYDLWALARTFAFDGDELRRAIGATFARRSIAVPDTVPTGLTSVFATDARKIRQWTAFLRKSVSPTLAPPTLEEVSAVLATFLVPVLTGTREGEDFVMRWPPGGPWEQRIEV